MADEELKNLVNNLKNIGVLKTPAIIEAFLKIDRVDFVPDEIKNLAYFDEALSIGQGQTISQPYTVAFMLELLEPKAGEKIMDIGAGSGWQTALLAHIVSKPALGKVFAIERVSELCTFGKANVFKYNFIKKEIVEWFCQDASDGLPEVAKKNNGFDKIIVAAEVAQIPEPWKEQLKIGGRLVLPIRNSIRLFIRKSKNDFLVQEYPGFVFVPFIRE